MKPNQKVIIYRQGMRVGPSTKSMQMNKYNAKYHGRDQQCPRCNRFLRDVTRGHYSDPPNKISCLDFTV